MNNKETIIVKKDIIVNYQVTKQENEKVDMGKLVNTVLAYVQNNEIHFTYTPVFHEGVLLFGITGFKRDHELIKKVLGDIISDLNCKLLWI